MTPRYIAPPGMKRCPRCKTFKPFGNFRGGYCLDCGKSYRRERANAIRRDVVMELKLKALAAYGQKCAGCGIMDPDVLDILPHGKNGRETFYRFLSTHNYPPGYRVLCANCERKLAA